MNKKPMIPLPGAGEMPNDLIHVALNKMRIILTVMGDSARGMDSNEVNGCLAILEDVAETLIPIAAFLDDAEVPNGRAIYLKARVDAATKKGGAQ